MAKLGAMKHPVDVNDLGEALVVVGVEPGRADDHVDPVLGGPQ